MTAEQQVHAILAQDRAFCARLAAARQLGLAQWCLGGGALRDVVWAHLSGRSVPPPRDLDLAYFDPGQLGTEPEAALEAQLGALDPGQPWEVRNQARMHLWHHAHTGERVPAVGSLAEGISMWPEPCTAVGAWLDARGRIQLVAPLGVDDLLDRVVRWNPARISAAAWRRRTSAKRWLERWPGVRILPVP